MSVEEKWKVGRDGTGWGRVVPKRPVEGGADGTRDRRERSRPSHPGVRPSTSAEVECHASGAAVSASAGAAHLLAVLAVRFPRGFTARAVATRLSLVGDDELQHAFETVGFWRRRVTGAVVGQWLGRLRDRAADGRVLRPGKLIDGYRRYRITEAL